MKKPIICLLFFGLNLPYALSKETIRDRVLEILPKELSSITSKDTRKDLETKFSSKIQKKDQPDTLYLKYFEDKNDVTIGTKEGKFNYLYVEFPRSIADSKEQFYSKIVSELSEAQKKRIAEENQKKISHETGRYIIIDLPEEGLKLEFINNEQKSLHSAILFPKERQ
jgi:hypothetical protein